MTSMDEMKSTDEMKLINAIIKRVCTDYPHPAYRWAILNKHRLGFSEKYIYKPIFLYDILQNRKQILEKYINNLIANGAPNSLIKDNELELELVDKALNKLFPRLKSLLDYYTLNDHKTRLKEEKNEIRYIERERSEAIKKYFESIKNTQ
jgi:hypothetical protein